MIVMLRRTYYFHAELVCLNGGTFNTVGLALYPGRLKEKWPGNLPGFQVHMDTTSQKTETVQVYQSQ